MAEKPAAIKQRKILDDLNSDKQDLALSALKLLEIDGRLAIIPELFEIYRKQRNTEVKKKDFRIYLQYTKAGGSNRNCSFD